jgi:uncharacterized protein YjbI with pentapeptide repeats
VITISHRGCADVILLQVNDSRLDGWDLTEAYLPGAQMSRLSCAGTILRGATLRKADLQGTDLRRADLTGANLREADLRGTDLSDANLTDADLTGVRFDERTRWPGSSAPIAPPETVHEPIDEPSDPAVIAGVVARLLSGQLTAAVVGLV